MKTIIIIATSMLITLLASGQQKDLREINVKAPQYASVHFESLDEFISTAVEYPADAKKLGAQGTVVVGFKVTTEGKIKDYKIVNSVCHSIDNAVVRALDITNGKWNPGTVNGEPAEMYKEISVVFQASKNADFIALAREYIIKANDLLFYKNQPQKAIKYLDKGITLLPNEEALLASRSLCRYQLGDMNGAERDWARIKLLSQNSEIQSNFELVKNFESLDGYDKMLSELAK